MGRAVHGRMGAGALMAEPLEMVVRVKYEEWEPSFWREFQRGVIIAHFIGAALLFLWLEQAARFPDQKVGYFTGLVLACGFAWREIREREEVG
jgi:hypothetical protein